MNALLPVVVTAVTLGAVGLAYAVHQFASALGHKTTGGVGAGESLASPVSTRQLAARGSE